MPRVFLFLMIASLLAACESQAATGSSSISSSQETPVMLEPTGHIVFQSNRDDNLEIYIMDADGSNPIRLTNDALRDEEPALSPDGQKVIFQRFAGTGYDLFTVDIVDKRVGTLINSADWETGAVFSPDGLFIAYTADVGASDEELFTADINGEFIHQLTDNSVMDTAPSWSSDNTQLVFQNNRGGNNNLYILTLESGEVTQLTDAAADDISPTWSPDGQTIAFASNRDGSNDIYTIGVDGQNLVRLTLDDSDDTYPTWSLDGMWLAFESDRAGKSDIWIMRADGSDARNLTADSRNDNSHPFWGR